MENTGLTPPGLSSPPKARNHEDWIKSYMALQENTEPPTLFHEWIAISIIAGALQRKVVLRWGPMRFYPNMYIVLVAPSGKCRKGTAMSAGAEFLRKIGVRMSAEAITREALIRELGESASTFMDVEGHLAMHASLTIYSQELTVFLGQNNLQLLSDITDWYDCRDNWTYRTKGSGTDDITGVYVNLIGATTPDLIQTALPRDAIGGGLASRMIMVYADAKAKTVATPFVSPEETALKRTLTEDLEQIHAMTGYVQVTNEFVTEWTKWYTAQEKTPKFQDQNFAGYVERRPNHVLKLCTILAASEGSIYPQTGQLYVTDKILARAVDLLERTETSMPRVFLGYGSGKHANLTARMIRHFENLKRPIPEAELFRAFHSDVDNPDEFKSVLETLRIMGFMETTMRGSITYYSKRNSYAG